MNKESAIYQLSRLNEFNRKLKDNWLVRQGLTEFYSSSELDELQERMEQLLSIRIQIIENNLKELL